MDQKFNPLKILPKLNENASAGRGFKKEGV